MRLISSKLAPRSAGHWQIKIARQPHPSCSARARRQALAASRFGQPPDPGEERASHRPGPRRCPQSTGASPLRSGSDPSDRCCGDNRSAHGHRLVIFRRLRRQRAGHHADGGALRERGDRPHGTRTSMAGLRRGESRHGGEGEHADHRETRRSATRSRMRPKTSLANQRMLRPLGSVHRADEHQLAPPCGRGREGLEISPAQHRSAVPTKPRRNERPHRLASISDRRSVKPPAFALAHYRSIRRMQPHVGAAAADSAGTAAWRSRSWPRHCAEKARLVRAARPATFSDGKEESADDRSAARQAGAPARGTREIVARRSRREAVEEVREQAATKATLNFRLAAERHDHYFLRILAGALAGIGPPRGPSSRHR